METLKELQPYAYFFYTVFLVVILYGYIVHLYRAKEMEQEITKNMHS